MYASQHFSKAAYAEEGLGSITGDGYQISPPASWARCEELPMEVLVQNTSRRTSHCFELARNVARFAIRLQRIALIDVYQRAAK